MITVLHVETGTSGGGSFESLYHLATHLDGTRYDPHIVFLNRTSYVEKLQDHGIPVTLLDHPRYSQDVHPKIRLWTDRIERLTERTAPSLLPAATRLLHRPAIRALSRLIRQTDAALVHTNVQARRDLFAALAAHNHDVPTIAHLRSMRAGLEPPTAGWLNARVRTFVANSHACRSHWIQQGLDPDRIQVIFNALPDLSIDPIDARATWDLPDNAKVLGAVGNFHPAKGHAFLLDAFAGLAQDQPEAHLLLVGTGPLQAHLEDQIDELSIGDRVHLTGYREDAVSIIAGLDALIIPSRSETFGRVAIEGMHAGTPVIATDVGGLTEVIEDGRTGLTVPYGDTDALNHAITRILEDRALSDRLSKAAKHDRQARFSIDTHVEAMTTLFDKALAHELPPMRPPR